MPGVSRVGLFLCLFSGAVVVLAGYYYRERRSPITCGPASHLRPLTSIERAVENFKVEYGAMPAASAKLTTDSTEGVEFLNVLLGLELDFPEMKNPRKINFLPYKEAREGRDGLVYDSNGLRVKGLFDPWGSPLTVMLDAENAGEVRIHHSSGEPKLEGKSVAVVSPGKDKKIGTADDIRSW